MKIKSAQLSILHLLSLISIGLFSLSACDETPRPRGEPLTQAGDRSIELEGDSETGRDTLDMRLGEDMRAADEDRSDEFYDPLQVHQIEIEIADADWETLCAESRGSILWRPDCMSAPFPSPYNWTIVQLTINGERFEEVRLRKKGFYGSLSSQKPSLKVRLDKFLEDQNFLGVTRFALNNSQQDPSYLRQCLAYELFRRAEIPSSRCGFAEVSINGEPLGLFVVVEELKRDYLRRNFDDPDGRLYEGTLSDFRPEWLGTFEQKNREESPSRAALEGVTAALEAPDDQLFEELAGHLDVEQFIRYWTMETIIAHWDGYAGNTNNFYLYESPETGRLSFLPWGVDGTFGSPLQLFEGQLAPRSVNVAGALARRLYLHPEGQQRYLEQLQASLAQYWDEEQLLARIEEILEPLLPRVPLSDTLGFNDSLAKLRDFIRKQGRLIEEELAEGPVVWDTPLRGGLCGEEIGVIQSTLETTWGSWPTEDAFQTGGGEASVTVFEQELEVSAVGAALGVDEEDSTRALLIAPLFLGDLGLFFVRIYFPLGELERGANFDLSDERFGCALFGFDLESGEISEGGNCISGELTFSEFSPASGARVALAYDAFLWGNPEAFYSLERE